MHDRRDEILNESHQAEVEKYGMQSISTKHFPLAYRDAAINAMDEYMKETCLELLEYIVKKVSNFWLDDDGMAKFKLSGDEELTKEQLFENFL